MEVILSVCETHAPSIAFTTITLPATIRAVKEERLDSPTCQDYTFVLPSIGVFPK